MKDGEIRQLIKQEIAITFAELRADMAEMKKNNEAQNQTLGRIERCLLGDKDLSDIGLAEKVDFSYNYARRNTESNLVSRAEKAINHYQRWVDEGHWTDTLEVNKHFKAIKWVVALVTGSGIVAIINIIQSILEITR